MSVRKVLWSPVRLVFGLGLWDKEIKFDSVARQGSSPVGRSGGATWRAGCGGLSAGHWYRTVFGDWEDLRSNFNKRRQLEALLRVAEH